MNHEAGLVMLLFLGACGSLFGLGVLLSEMKERTRHRQEMLRYGVSNYPLTPWERY